MRTVEWALATFHTTLFFALVVLSVYPTGRLGNLLAALNTLIGTFVFVLFWLVTWYCTRSAVRRILRTRSGPLPPFGRAEIRRALLIGPLWGGIEGILVLQIGLIGVVLFIAAQALGWLELRAATLPEIIAQLFVVTASGQVFGLLPAFIVGAVVGVFFVAVDSLLLAVARSLARR